MKISPGLRSVLLAALAAGLHAEEKPAGNPEKSANWLVDAMAEKTADPRDASRPGVASADAGSATNARGYSKPEDGSANPLSSYLAAWMTPRDLEILKIKTTDANTPGVTTGPGQDRLVSRGPAQGPLTNPYLADPTPPTSISPKTPPTLPVPAPATLAPPAPKNDAAPAKTPGPPADLIKSQEEQKYFPQLKRF